MVDIAGRLLERERKVRGLSVVDYFNFLLSEDREGAENILDQLMLESLIYDQQMADAYQRTLPRCKGRAAADLECCAGHRRLKAMWDDIQAKAFYISRRTLTIQQDEVDPDWLTGYDSRCGDCSVLSERWWKLYTE